MQVNVELGEACTEEGVVVDNGPKLREGVGVATGGHGDSGLGSKGELQLKSGLSRIHPHAHQVGHDVAARLVGVPHVGNHGCWAGYACLRPTVLLKEIGSSEVGGEDVPVAVEAPHA